MHELKGGRTTAGRRGGRLVLFSALFKGGLALLCVCVKYRNSGCRLTMDLGCVFPGICCAHASQYIRVECFGVCRFRGVSRERRNEDDACGNIGYIVLITVGRGARIITVCARREKNCGKKIFPASWCRFIFNVACDASNIKNIKKSRFVL